MFFVKGLAWTKFQEKSIPAVTKKRAIADRSNNKEYI
jgi:hypothetical protein